MAHRTDDLNDALGEELRRVERAEAELEAQLRDLAAQLDAVRRKRDLVKALLEMPAGSAAEDGAKAANASAVVAGLGRSGEKPSANGRSVADIAYKILLDRGKNPMHFEDLADRVKAAGGTLGGASPSQTLIARICKDDRFVRPQKRGWYAAAQFYPRARSVGRRKRHTGPGRK